MMKYCLNVEKRYLHIPVSNTQKKNRITLSDAQNGTLFSYFDLAVSEESPDFIACYDVSAMTGQTLQVEGTASPAFLSMTRQSDEGPCPGNNYSGKYRPQYHFSAYRGWLNDPNGLFYYEGTWHLFFQHNPFYSSWGNMHWGHAISNDLIHWRESGDVLSPDEHGTIFSGSAVVDWHNTSGLRMSEGKHPPILLFYTAAGNQAPVPHDFTQCMAYSLDGGITFEKYDRNPVLPCVAHENRDPKIIWHEPTRQWIMALYLGDRKKTFALFRSGNLLQWDFLQELSIESGGECPDFFSLKVDGSGEEKWLLIEANGRYLIGDFDGMEFKPEAGPFFSCCFRGANGYYAGQSWSDAKDGRRLMIGWLRGYSGAAEFEQSMTVAMELTLRRFSDGLRLCANPIRGLDVLRVRSWDFQEIGPERNCELMAIPPGDCWDIELEFGEMCNLYMKLCGKDIAFDRNAREIRFAAVKIVFPEDDARLTCRILVDRNSVEIFTGTGRVWSAGPELIDPSIPLHFNCGSYLSALCGSLKSLRIHQLKSIWS